MDAGNLGLSPHTDGFPRDKGHQLLFMSKTEPADIKDAENEKPGMGIGVVLTKDLETQHWFGLTKSALRKGFDFRDLLMPNLQCPREAGDSTRSLEIKITEEGSLSPEVWHKQLLCCTPGFAFLLLPQQSMSCARHLLPVPITGCPQPSGGWLLKAREKRALE